MFPTSTSTLPPPNVRYFFSHSVQFGPLPLSTTSTTYASFSQCLSDSSLSLVRFSAFLNCSKFEMLYEIYVPSGGSLIQMHWLQPVFLAIFDES